MGWEVIIAACLINNPGECKDFHYEIEGNGSMPMVCHMEAQQKIIQNLPRGYEYKKWHCELPNKDVAKI